MRKSSTTTRRRSSSNPGRISQGAKGKEESMIPKPKMRSLSSDRLSGLRRSNLRPTTGAKSSLGQYTTVSSMVSPMPSSRYTHTIDKTGRPSYVDQANLASKGFITPMASGSRHTAVGNDSRNVRASSVERAINLAPKGPKKDNRPLTDKNFQNELLNKIDKYFYSIGQSTILNNNGSLKPLTLKIFIDVTNLLVKLLDMKISITSANYIEEIPKISKQLSYSGTLNKSWLKTANTPHSWPHALGWVGWLVELCEVKDVASEIFTLEKLPIAEENEEKKENYRSIFLAMIECYKAWNDEKPEEEERIIKEFFEREAERRGVTEQKQEEITTEVEKLEEKLKTEEAELDKINAEVTELQNALLNLKNDKIKQKESILVEQKYIEKTAKEIEDLKTESEKFSKDIEKLEATREELNEAIRHQPMSVVERDEILKACTEQQAYIQNFDAHLEEIRKEAYSLDIRLVSTNSSLVKTILAYNQSLFLQLSNSKINIDDLLMPENGICEASFLDILEEKKALMDNFMQEQAKELSDLEKTLEILTREKETMQAKRDALMEKVEMSKAEEEMKKQDLKVKENKKREEIKKWQNINKELDESILKTKNELEALDQELAESTDKKEALERQKLYLEETVIPFIEQVNGIVDEHNDEFCKSLESILKTEHT